MKKLFIILLAVLAVGCADKTTKKLAETDPLVARVLDFKTERLTQAAAQ